MIAQRKEQSQLQIDYSLSTLSLRSCVFFLSEKVFHSFSVGELQIRHLSMGQSSGHELARASDLSNFEIGEHIDILREAGMVSVEKMNQMMYFSLNKEAVVLRLVELLKAL